MILKFSQKRKTRDYNLNLECLLHFFGSTTNSKNFFEILKIIMRGSKKITKFLLLRVKHKFYLKKPLIKI